LKRYLLLTSFACQLDYSGQRIKKTVAQSGITTRFAGQLYEEDNTGAEYQHVFVGNTRVATIAPLGVQFYHGDHLGSRSVVTDSDGLEVDHIDYKPFGEINRHDAVASEEGHHFTDQYRDDETELYYYGARYYNPKVGRFTQADTIVPEPGNPQALNRYAYVFNNPLNLVDPSGNIPGVHNFVSPEFLNTPAYDPFSHFGSSILNDGGLTSAALNSLLTPTSFVQRVADFSQGFFLDGIGQAVKGAIAPQESAQGLVDAFSNPGDVLTGLGGLLSSDRGAGQAAFLALGLLTTRSAPTTSNAGTKLFHYTQLRNVDNILENGIRPGKTGKVFTTPSGNLTPLQAQIELSLPANRGLSNAVFEIDINTLNSLNIKPSSGPLRVLPTSTAPGGGFEVLFDQLIPSEAIRRIR